MRVPPVWTAAERLMINNGPAMPRVVSRLLRIDMRVWLGVLGLVSTPLLWAGEGEAWLARMIEAQASQSYQGRFVYERQGSFMAHRLWRRAEPGLQVERLLQLDGLPREIVRRNGQLVCQSDADSQASWSLPPVQARVTAQALLGHYQVRLLGSHRIAGREAEELALSPRDSHRYALQLSLDRHSGLPLRSMIVGEQGQLLERMQFIDLELQPPTDEQLQPLGACRAVQASPGVSDRPLWQAGWLPPGFVAQASWQQAVPAGTAVLTQVYGDGLVSLSVFIEALQEGQAADAHSQVGPTAIHSRRHGTAQGDFMVTVVGEVPPVTAERVALSMRAPEDKP